MTPRLLLAAGILLLAACSHHSYSYGSGSGTQPFRDGVIETSYHRSGQQGGSGISQIKLHEGHSLDDYQFRLYVFQDLDGNGRYAAQIDRVLAEDTGLTRVSDREGTLSATSFDFRGVHEPIGIHWRVIGPGGELLSTDDSML